MDLVRLGRVQYLPDPVQSIDYSIVLAKRRVVKRGKDVGAVAPYSVVAGNVNTEGTVRSLNLVLDVSDGLRGRTDSKVK
jgi:hypothetical protein